jgi:hypothetical protein
MGASGIVDLLKPPSSSPTLKKEDKDENSQDRKSVPVRHVGMKPPTRASAGSTSRGPDEDVC